jgi:hypothetical protein
LHLGASLKIPISFVGYSFIKQIAQMGLSTKSLSNGSELAFLMQRNCSAPAQRVVGFLRPAVQTYNPILHISPDSVTIPTPKGLPLMERQQSWVKKRNSLVPLHPSRTIKVDVCQAQIEVKNI